MIHLALLLLCLGGFVLLLLAYSRHQQDWLGCKLAAPSCRRLRLMGFAMILVAFALAGLGLGWAYGAVCWFGWLMIGGATVAIVNSNRERLQRRTRR